MDFTLPEELRMLRDNLRRYVEKEMIPVERDSVTDEEELKPEYREKFQKGMRDLGLWMYDVPEEHGGQGLGVMARCVIWEEMARTIAVPARHSEITGPSVRAILYDLPEDMKQRYLYPVLRGEKHACFGQTEPDAGSDPGGMRTTAVRDGDDYLINGTKRFITGAASADFIQLMAATDRAKGSRGGISCFIVDMDAPGVKITARFKTMMGDRPCEIHFDNVRVPWGQRVGAEGEGFTFGQKWLGIGRLHHAARAIGVAERCLGLATNYSKQRVTFGQPLSQRQSIQWMLVDSYVEIKAARLMLYEAATKMEAGEDVRNDCYVVKMYADEMSFQVVDRAMQIHGGIALTTDLPIERMWRQQRSYRITEGATEVMKMVIARHVLKSY